MSHIYEIIRSLPKDELFVITIGTFDGMHTGHQKIILKMKEIANCRALKTVLITFHPHPSHILQLPNCQPVLLLTTYQEKAAIAKNLGIDFVLSLPFNRQLSLMDSSAFINMLHEHIPFTDYVIGYDHRFGRNREGGVEVVKNLSKEIRFDVHVIPPQKMDNIVIKSSLIRSKLIEHGDVSFFRKATNRPYRLEGIVIHGSKQGTKMGYPTANINSINVVKLVPADGVYCGIAYYKEEAYQAMINIGSKPTFKYSNHVIEVHLLDTSVNLYGHRLVIDLYARLRCEIKFSDSHQLVNQIKQDEQVSRKILYPFWNS